MIAGKIKRESAREDFKYESDAEPDPAFKKGRILRQPPDAESDVNVRLAKRFREPRQGRVNQLPLAQTASSDRLVETLGRLNLPFPRTGRAGRV